MYGYHQGYSFEDNISYCPLCGAEIEEWRADGTGFCKKCKNRFAVIFMDKEKAPGGGGYCE